MITIMDMLHVRQKRPAVVHVVSSYWFVILVDRRLRVGEKIALTESKCSAVAFYAYINRRHERFDVKYLVVLDGKSSSCFIMTL